MSKTILVVEDYEPNLRLVCDMLAIHGHSTLQSARGADAIDLAMEHHPDLIVLDLVLPDMSGLEVARLIRKTAKSKDIPIIAVSAYAVDADQDRIKQAGCDVYLAKPLEFRLFLEIIRYALGAANDP